MEIRQYTFLDLTLSQQYLLLMNIKKIIREEIEVDPDFKWIDDIPSFIPGKYFEEEDICFDTYGDDCKVNISDDETVFVLDYEDWRDKISEGFGDSDHIVEPFLQYTNYDGDGDYYDFDEEDFNYSGYHMNNEQRERFRKILNLFNPYGHLEGFLNDDMNGIEKYLTNKEIKDYFIDLRYRYLEIIGYQVQENRWKSIGEYYKNVTLEAQNQYNISVKFVKKSVRWGDDIEITVKTQDLVNLLSQKNEPDLSRALDMLSSVITRPNWYGYFFEDWDTSGAEDDIRNTFETFLDRTETYIEENSEEFKEQLDFYDSLKKLGFTTRGGQSDMWFKETPDGGMWVISRINFQDYKLRLDKKDTTNMWNPTDEKNIFVIDLDDLPIYLSQYRMDI